MYNKNINMNNEFLKMQKLAGLITEGQYKAKLNENIEDYYGEIQAAEDEFAGGIETGSYTEEEYLNALLDASNEELEDFQGGYYDIAKVLSNLSDEEIYFDSIEYLLKDYAKNLNILNDITLTIDDYKKEKALMNNFVKRVNEKKSELTLSKVKDIINFKNTIINNKLKIDTKNTEEKCEIKVSSFKIIYEKIFKNKDETIKNIDTMILDNIDSNNIEMIDKMEDLKSIIEKFYIYPGLSIEDFEKIEATCKTSKLF